jgi:uncharacterized protein
MATVIFKATEACNSNCIYCEVVKKHKPDVMSHNLLAVVFRRLNDYLLLHPGETINFTWHGGEACILGADYFNFARDLQEKYCSCTKNRIKHLVQSNLTILTQEMVNAFKSLGIEKVGSSFEPLPNIRGFGADRNSRLYNAKFMEGINLLAENGMSWGVIYVVHKRSLGMATRILHYLSNLNPSSQPMFNMIYLYKGDPHNLWITPEEFADFLGELVPLYWENRARFPHLQPISRFAERIVYGRKASTCDFSGKCAYAWVYIGPTGNASQCGRAGDFDYMGYGNIADKSLEEILHDPFRDRIEKRQEILQNAECKECRFWGLCHGSCPLDALNAYGTLDKPSPNCAWIKRLLEKYLEPVIGVRANLPPGQE